MKRGREILINLFLPPTVVVRMGSDDFKVFPLTIKHCGKHWKKLDSQKHLYLTDLKKTKNE